jgi:hypothetical protein
LASVENISHDVLFDVHVVNNKVGDCLVLPRDASDKLDRSAPESLTNLTVGNQTNDLFVDNREEKRVKQARAEVAAGNLSVVEQRLVLGSTVVRLLALHALDGGLGHAPRSIVSALDKHAHFLDLLKAKTRISDSQ